MPRKFTVNLTTKYQQLFCINTIKLYFWFVTFQKFLTFREISFKMSISPEISGNLLRLDYNIFWRLIGLKWRATQWVGSKLNHASNNNFSI